MPRMGIISLSLSAMEQLLKLPPGAHIDRIVQPDQYFRGEVKIILSGHENLREVKEGELLMEYVLVHGDGEEYARIVGH